MLHQLEELRRAASNNDLRHAYEAAIGSLDAVVYRLAMLRAPGSAPKSSAPASRAAATARTGAARKPGRR